LQNLKTPAAWTVHELLGTDDVYELFVNTIKIYTPKVSFVIVEGLRVRCILEHLFCNAVMHYLTMMACNCC